MGKIYEQFQTSNLKTDDSTFVSQLISRQDDLVKKVEYVEVTENINKLLNEIKRIPGTEKLAFELDEWITHYENVVFKDAYICGIKDFSTALTFNKLGITMTALLCEGN